MQKNYLSVIPPSQYEPPSCQWVQQNSQVPRADKLGQQKVQIGKSCLSVINAELNMIEYL